LEQAASETVGIIVERDGKRWDESGRRGKHTCAVVIEE
jgi:hypothetical protein